MLNPPLPLQPIFVQVGIGSTYNSHPVALASAYASLQVFVRENLPQRAADMQPIMEVGVERE